MTAKELVAQAEKGRLFAFPGVLDSDHVQLMEVCTSDAVKYPTCPGFGRAHAQPSSKRDHEREAVRSAVLGVVVYRQISLGNQCPVNFRLSQRGQCGFIS
jgi:hypothetical protein